MNQKKEMLMEIIEIMKLTLGNNLNYKEARRGKPFVGRLYFYDKDRDEALLLVDKIPIMSVISKQLAGIKT